MNVKRHIVNLSGGKDSTAMLLMMLERNMPVDEIMVVDTGMEFPQMYDHLDKLENYVGIKFTYLKNPLGFHYWMFDHVRIRGKNKGLQGYSWPEPKSRWCTSQLKLEPIRKHLAQYENEEIQRYLGIAYDERERAREFNYPLIDWEITEEQALQYCYDHGFKWGGLYELFGRVSCWCCPLQGLEELRNLRKHFPDLWSELKEMESRTRRSFRADYNVMDLERKFALEDLGLIKKHERKKVFDRTFHPEND